MMKKLLGSTLVLALLFPSQVSAAELLKNLKFSGQIDIQSTAARNISDFTTRQQNNGAGGSRIDRVGDTNTRTMIMADWNVLDDVMAHATLAKGNYTYGAGPETITGYETAIEIQEANIKIAKAFGALDTTIGRQFVGSEGDLIAYYGPRSYYGLSVDALDAFRFDWSGENMNATIIAGKPDGNTAGTGIAAADEQDIRALILSCKGQGAIKGSAYIWNKATHRAGAGGYGSPASEASTGGKNDNLYIAGIKAKGAMGAFFANAEFAKNFGIQRIDGTTDIAPTASYTGWAFKADGGIKADIEGIGAITPWGQFAIGTGRSNSRENVNEDFQTINTDFYPGSIYGRFAAASALGLGSGIGATVAPAGNGLTNRVIYGVGIKITPAAINKLTAGLAWYNYRFHRTTQFPSQTAGTVPGNGNKQIGTEADLDLSWKHSENVTFNGGVGTFQPGGYIKETIQSTNSAQASANSQRGVNPATLAYFDVRVKFGGNN